MRPRPLPTDRTPYGPVPPSHHEHRRGLLPVPPHAVRVEETGDRCHVALAGELDLTAVPDLDRAFAAYRTSRSRDVHVDMAAVTFMDLTGLTWVARLLRVARDRGGRVTLWDVPASTWRVFTLMGLDALVVRAAGVEQRSSAQTG